jgi:hypothetical protein
MLWSMLCVRPPAYLSVTVRRHFSFEGVSCGSPTAPTRLLHVLHFLPESTRHTSRAHTRALGIAASHGVPDCNNDLQPARPHYQPSPHRPLQTALPSPLASCAEHLIASASRKDPSETPRRELLQRPELLQNQMPVVAARLAWVLLGAQRLRQCCVSVLLAPLPGPSAARN